MNPTNSFVPGGATDITPEDCVRTEQKTPEQRAADFVQAMIEKAKPALLALVRKEIAARVLAVATRKAFGLPKPEGYERVSWDKATLDLSRFGWGTAIIGDTPANVAARLTAVTTQAMNKDPWSVQVQAVSLQAHLRKIEIGDPNSPAYANAKACPEVHHSEEKWIGFVGSVPAKVMTRLQEAFAFFEADEGVEGNE